ncbi:hypothetical protein QJS04_geneDACA001563 [Acorus gramineus]|uniref:Uncharacterized protein n=1 Tax=Acorus gramineus TaxID=55184 RepID=A0AAV9BIT0_ACOGR|nr:hypothetical protein QJS04_geneDACA001563 [Acorus gramineus]
MNYLMISYGVITFKHHIIYVFIKCLNELYLVIRFFFYLYIGWKLCKILTCYIEDEDLVEQWGEGEEARLVEEGRPGWWGQ